MIMLIFGHTSCTPAQEWLSWLIEPPTVVATELKLTKFSIQKLQLTVRLTIANPNRFSLNFGAVRYSISVGDEPLAKGIIPTKSVLAAKSETTIAIPLELKPAKIFSRTLLSIVRTQSLSLSCEFETTLQSLVGAIPLHFTAQKSLKTP